MGEAVVELVAAVPAVRQASPIGSQFIPFPLELGDAKLKAAVESLTAAWVKSSEINDDEKACEAKTRASSAKKCLKYLLCNISIPFNNSKVDLNPSVCF